MVSNCLISATRRLFSKPSVISSLAFANTSPVSGSVMVFAITRPSKKSSGTDTVLIPALPRSRKCLALIRLSFSIMTLPLLSVISKLITSPFKRSGISSITAPSSFRSNTSVSKKVDKMLSGVIPIALRRIVTGILRRRSIRKNKMSFASNSKSNHEPR